MDQCPKCGADLDTDGKYVKDYACGSIKNKSGGFLQRDACKDRQIAKLQERLAGALEFVHFLADNAVKERSRDGEIVCRYCLQDPCRSDCVAAGAKRFLEV